MLIRLLGMRPLRKLIFLVFVKAMLRFAVGGLYSSKLYSFGKEAGDSHLPIKDDVSSDAISTPPFYFFGLEVNAFYVHENGLITFGSGTLKDQSPSSFPLTDKVHAAAPYWADVYTERGGRVWYRITTEQRIISRATRDVIRAFPRYTEFMASWVAIITWDEVTFFGASGIYTQNRNTFQVLIASNEIMSFAAYIYDKLSWTSDTLHGGDNQGLGGKPAQVGFSFGRSYQKVSVSGTDDVLSLVTRTNCGQPGVWLFRVDDVKVMDEKRCESKGTVFIHPTGGQLHSGSNVLITGLCYWPGNELRCDFGDMGTVKGYKVNETKAVCTVPLLTTRKQQVSVYVYPSEDVKLRFAQVFDLEPVHFYDKFVQRSEPETWTSGTRVEISWNVLELGADLPVTVEIISLFYGQDGIEVQNNVTVVSNQPNKGKAKFDLPRMENLKTDQNAPTTLQMIRVRSLMNTEYNKYIPKEWIGSELFLLTNQSSANESCSSWLKSQTFSLTESHSHLTPCPKTRRQMNADIGLFTVCELCDTQILPICKIYYKKVDICYKTRTASDRGLKRMCCYDNKGELTAGPSSQITNRNKHPATTESLFLLLWEDIVPYLQCCMFSDNCFKYQELVTSESRYIPPNIGASFGDPHILTLDGVEYTFNGFGEYTVLNVNNTQFLLQGRMQPLKGEQNGKSPATVFTAFVMKEQGSSSIQVQQNDLQSIDVLIDGKLSVIDHGHELQSEGVFVRNSSRENNPRVILAFSSGITVYIENAAAVLQMAVVVPVQFKGKTSGLLGYWDDNSDKEYLLPNNVFLNTASTMSELHHKFGQQWVTKETDSLFTYGAEEAHKDYFDTSYIPTFMEGYDPIISKMNNGVKKRALMTCEHSVQCIFDIAVTGRLGVGKATKEFQEWLTGMKRELHDEGCNVVLSLADGSVRTEVTGDLVTHYFTCNHGYIMAGKDRISCRGGDWDGSRPTCFRASTVCKQLMISFPNGHFSGKGSNVGDRYNFKCDSPYTLAGKEEIVCGEDGLWSGQVPLCQGTNCSQVQINNSQVKVGNEGQLVITCNPGYTLIGSSVLSCLPNGLLNGTLPSCSRDQFWRGSPEEKDFLVVIVVGVIVIVIAIIVIVATIYLVRKHHRRKKTQVPKKAAKGEDERVAV